MCVCLQYMYDMYVYNFLHIIIILYYKYIYIYLTLTRQWDATWTSDLRLLWEDRGFGHASCCADFGPEGSLGFGQVELRKVLDEHTEHTERTLTF